MASRSDSTRPGTPACTREDQPGGAPRLTARHLLAAGVLSACSAAGPVGLDTGLTGTVARSPVTPVCQAGVPCSAPFSAQFAIRQGSLPIASFRSDSQGRFAVALRPGAYQVVPGADAPIIDPQSQVKSVVVLPGPLTSVQLEFDTGLR